MEKKFLMQKNIIKSRKSCRPAGRHLWDPIKESTFMIPIKELAIKELAVYSFSRLFLLLFLLFIPLSS